LTINEITQVPFLDLKAQYHQIKDEIGERFEDILADTGFILGKHVAEFEQGFAKLQEAKYCIGVSSGTDALHIALIALGIGHGDAVIVPVNTFIATAEAVSLCGATPLFVDCDEFSNLSVDGLGDILTLRAEGVISHPSSLSRATPRQADSHRLTQTFSPAYSAERKGVIASR